jgi:hypothetical protein
MWMHMRMMMIQKWVQMRMVVMVFRHIHRNTARHFDFDFSKAAFAWTTMNADEILHTRRI